MKIVDVVTIGSTCNNCGVYDTVKLERQRLMIYLEEMQTVQEAFPEYSTEDRELIIGYKRKQYYCPICWDELLGGLDEAEMLDRPEPF